jgi:hypothetical protein
MNLQFFRDFIFFILIQPALYFKFIFGYDDQGIICNQKDFFILNYFGLRNCFYELILLIKGKYLFLYGFVKIFITETISLDHVLFL